MTNITKDMTTSIDITKIKVIDYPNSRLSKRQELTYNDVFIGSYSEYPDDGFGKVKARSNDPIMLSWLKLWLKYYEDKKFQELEIRRAKEERDARNTLKADIVKMWIDIGAITDE
jgi:hypothetical protein